MTHDLVLSSRRDTVRLGRVIAAKLRPGDLVLLNGPLGAGKTFLARAIAHSLGVSGGVPSPTFALVNEYTTDARELLHADLYRLIGDVESSSDSALAHAVGQLGLRERRAEGAILLIEWATTGFGALGGPADLSVTMSLANPDARFAHVAGARGAEVLEALDELRSRARRRCPR